jgi:predicted nucleic acid-binding protein
MKILIDTSVWSLALRREQINEDDTSIVKELQELIRELRVVMIGPIRQELLSGITDTTKYAQLRDRLRAFDDVELDSGIYEMAAEISNICRKNGIQGSHTDFLICAFSINNKCPVFTLDKDFDLYKKHIDLLLHSVREEFR